MQRENIDDKDLLNNIHETISGLDEQRLQELNNLKQLQEIKNEVLQLETKRLINKHGEDHPRVQKIMARIAVNREVFIGLDKDVEKAAIKIEPLPANSWRVHGKVFGEKNLPVSGIAVFLSDREQTWIETLGSYCTNEAGYYSLTVEEKMVGEFEKQPLFLSASDKNKKVIYMDPEPLILSRGLIEYRDIYLNSEKCMPPSSTKKDHNYSNPTKKGQ